MPLVWVVNPDTRTVLVYHANRRVERLGENDELTAPDLIPELRCKVADLFSLPSPE